MKVRYRTAGVKQLQTVSYYPPYPPARTVAFLKREGQGRFS
uniref:Uncharacterized protein n=1 Tax=Anopheles atroparvus TaxID=41427 RepID=A0AAG5DHE4_ANOAO